MKRIPMVMLTLLATAITAGIVFAQDPGEVERQVPVIEDVEKPDVPAADEARGNREADIPAAERPASDIAPPAPEVQPPIVQPPVQQD